MLLCHDRRDGGKELGALGIRQVEKYPDAIRRRGSGSVS